MRVATIIDKHIKLDQGKIERARAILRAKNETETIMKALELVITGDREATDRIDALKRIMARRNSIAPIKGDVTRFIGAGRKQRDRI